MDKDKKMYIHIRKLVLLLWHLARHASVDAIVDVLEVTIELEEVD